MRRILLSCLAASFLSGGIGFAAAAQTLAAAVKGGSDTPLVQRVVNICGANGCVRVQTQRVQHPKAGNAAAKHI